MSLQLLGIRRQVGRLEDVAMHVIRISDELLAQRPANVWSIDRHELERIARNLSGDQSRTWIRGKENHTLIKTYRRGMLVRYQRGSLAEHLDEEFAILKEQTAAILRNCAWEVPLCAAVFFHLRFVHIHPLIDCNGRSGRFLFAAQCNLCYGLGYPDLLAPFNEYNKRYQWIFAHRQECRYELLLDFFSQHLGIPVCEEMSAAPYPIGPVFLDAFPCPEIHEPIFKTEDDARKEAPI